MRKRMLLNLSIAPKNRGLFLASQSWPSFCCFPIDPERHSFSLSSSGKSHEYCCNQSQPGLESIWTHNPTVLWPLYILVPGHSRHACTPVGKHVRWMHTDAMPEVPRDCSQIVVRGRHQLRPSARQEPQVRGRHLSSQPAHCFVFETSLCGGSLTNETSTSLHVGVILRCCHVPRQLSRH